MSYICPTVTATNIEEFDKQLKLVESLTNRIHIDLMDGVFAPTKSPEFAGLTFSKDLKLDIHVMFKDPEPLLEELITVAPRLVVVHAESILDIPLFATKLRENGINTGLAVLPETNLEGIDRLLPHVQHVLVFGGHLGYHGGEADLSQLDKVKQIKKANRHVEIGWDGGANTGNVRQIQEAGVDVINVGSGIHKSGDPAAAYKELVSLVD